MGAYDEVDDPLRVQLIEQIADRLGGKLVEPGFWAFVWLGDVDKLEAYTKWLIAGPKSSRYDICTNKSWTRALKIWTTHERFKDENKKRKSTAAIANPPTPSKISRGAESVGRAVEDIGASVALPPRGRSPSSKSRKSSTLIASDDCKRRDKHSCLVTRGGDCIETAHIYPFSLGTKVGSAGYEEFWDRLSMFWSPEKIRDWEDAVLDMERTETLPNLVCLASIVHDLWGKAKFALKPRELSADQTKLTVEFHWLQDSVYEPRDLRIPPTNPAKLDGTTRQTRLFNCVTKRYICSGDILTFTTEDPEKWPLPSVHLLYMQWVLNRLVALAGAVDVTDEELDPDNEADLSEQAEEEEDDEEGSEEEEKGPMENGWSGG